jgi:hypothetical protein
LLVEGGFLPVCDFLRRLEGWPGVAWVTDLKLEDRRHNGETLHCELNLTVFTPVSDTSD